MSEAPENLSLGDLLGDDLLWLMAEYHFIDCARRYERGEPTIVTDDQWDRLGYGLQMHPERWSRWFKDQVPWTPGVIEKPTRVGMHLGK